MCLFVGYCYYLSSILITCNVVGLHHVAAFVPCFLDRLRVHLMAVGAEYVSKVKQPGYLSHAMSL